jgi:hypothetical protein
MNAHNDSLTKFHFLKHQKKCRLKHISFDTNLNTLVTNPKLIAPLYYTHMSLIGQRPIIKTSIKSIASFKIRPNMVLGTHTTVQSNTPVFDSLLKNLKFAFLPGIKRHTEKLNPSLTLWSQNSTSCQINYPIENLNFLYSFFYLPPLSVDLGGANISVTSYYPNNHFYKALHSFYFSTHSLY